MIKLDKISTAAPQNASEKKIKEATAELVERLGDLQTMLYASRKHAVLVVLQGMDGSGKDGAIHKVFDACRITGMTFAAFKKPTEEEFAHDFLWRIQKHAPEKGNIAIFNRSHYEDILIQWVHGWIDDAKRKKRMAAINSWEQNLADDNSTIVFKFYLHISKEEQEKQLRQRLEDPEKFWKHNDGDWEERKLWDKYMDAYEFAINNSDTPWHVCPVDDRWYRDYFIAKTLVEELEKLEMTFPSMAAAQK